MSSGVHLGYIDASPAVESKIQEKHGITLAEVREALQFPAPVRIAPEEHPEHGYRWVAVGSCGGHVVIAWLLPLPEHEGATADSWTLKTARWVS